MPFKAAGVDNLSFGFFLRKESRDGILPLVFGWKFLFQLAHTAEEVA